jgi:hypothetical protein
MVFVAEPELRLFFDQESVSAKLRRTCRQGSRSRTSWGSQRRRHSSRTKPGGRPSR